MDVGFEGGGKRGAVEEKGEKYGRRTPSPDLPRLRKHGSLARSTTGVRAEPHTRLIEVGR